MKTMLTKLPSVKTNHLKLKNNQMKTTILKLEDNRTIAIRTAKPKVDTYVQMLDSAIQFKYDWTKKDLYQQLADQIASIGKLDGKLFADVWPDVMKSVPILLGKALAEKTEGKLCINDLGRHVLYVSKVERPYIIDLGKLFTNILTGDTDWEHSIVYIIKSKVSD
jgi:hypothetical protein